MGDCLDRYWIDKGQVPSHHVPGWWIPAGIADKRIAELERELREASAVMRLLRHHRLVERGGIPHDLLEREAAIIDE